jgi:hypothetical protein
MIQGSHIEPSLKRHFRFDGDNDTLAAVPICIVLQSHIRV